MRIGVAARITENVTRAGPRAERVTAAEPGVGPTGEWLPGVGVAFKIDGEDTGGVLAMVEHPFDVGAYVPPHIHHLEDEISIVLEGEMGFRSEDREVVLGPRGYIVKPHGEVHAMWNAGDTPARMIEVITPAGLERAFRAWADALASGPADPDTMAALEAESEQRYRCFSAEADWWPDLMERYGLAPPD